MSQPSPSRALSVEEMAARLKLTIIERGSSGMEWHGPNPTGAGATTDGFWLNEKGFGYDRTLHYTYPPAEVARLASMQPDEYAPHVEWVEHGSPRDWAPAPRRPALALVEGPKSAKVYDSRTLEERGVSAATQQRFGIVKKMLQDEAEVWEYPTTDMGGADAMPGKRRWKFRYPERADGKKYVWLDSKKEHIPKPLLYPWPEIEAALEAGITELWWVNGEPSDWLCYQEGVVAASAMGEGSQLADCMALLAAKKIRRIDVILDHDAAGVRAAVKVAEACKTVRIECVVHRFRPELAAKMGYDVADLWADWKAAGAAESFAVALAALPVVDAFDEEVVKKWLVASPEIPSGKPMPEKFAEPCKVHCPECWEPTLGLKKDGGAWCKSKGSCGAQFEPGDERVALEIKRRDAAKAVAPTGMGDSSAAQLLAVMGELEFFKINKSTGYVVIEHGGHTHTINVEDKFLGTLLDGIFYERCGGLLSAQGREGVVRHLGHQAIIGGELRKSFVRNGEFAGRLYISVANEAQQVVEIGPGLDGGWRVIDRAPGIHLDLGTCPLPLPLPEVCENEERRKQVWSDFRDLLGYAGDDLNARRNWVLSVAWVLGCFSSPESPFACLVVTGEEDSGKTTACRMLRMLVDPDDLESGAKPPDERDLAIKARNRFVLGWENLSNIPEWLSDALCRISTMGNFGVRKLHSDTGETIIKCMRPQMFNGIDRNFVTKPDLKRRSLFTHREALGGKKGSPSGTMQRFVDMWPALLGVIYDAAACGWCNLETTEVTAEEVGGMMWDLVEFIKACAPLLPFSYEEFLEVYSLSTREARLATLEDSLPSAIIEFAEGVKHWKGSAGVLQGEIEVLLAKESIGSDVYDRMASGDQGAARGRVVSAMKRGRSLPQKMNWMGDVLGRLANNLRERKIYVRRVSGGQWELRAGHEFVTIDDSEDRQLILDSVNGEDALGRPVDPSERDWNLVPGVIVDPVPAVDDDHDPFEDEP